MGGLGYLLALALSPLDHLWLTHEKKKGWFEPGQPGLNRVMNWFTNSPKTLILGQLPR